MILRSVIFWTLIHESVFCWDKIQFKEKKWTRKLSLTKKKQLKNFLAKGIACE